MVYITWAYTEWFINTDGKNANSSLELREYLNCIFRNQVVGCGTPQSWAPKSPDLNNLDRFPHSLKLYGLLKQLRIAKFVNEQN